LHRVLLFAIRYPSAAAIVVRAPPKAKPNAGVHARTALGSHNPDEQRVIGRNSDRALFDIGRHLDGEILGSRIPSLASARLMLASDGASAAFSSSTKRCVTLSSTLAFCPRSRDIVAS